MSLWEVLQHFERRQQPHVIMSTLPNEAKRKLTARHRIMQIEFPGIGTTWVLIENIFSTISRVSEHFNFLFLLAKVINFLRHLKGVYSHLSLRFSFHVYKKAGCAWMTSRDIEWQQNSNASLNLSTGRHQRITRESPLKGSLCNLQSHFTFPHPTSASSNIQLQARHLREESWDLWFRQRVSRNWIYVFWSENNCNSKECSKHPWIPLKRLNCVCFFDELLSCFCSPSTFALKYHFLEDSSIFYSVSC